MEASITPPSSSSFSFSQGFVLGQLSIIILIGCFIKFFIFGDVPSSDGLSPAHGRPRSRSSGAAYRPVSITNASGGNSVAKKISSVIRPSPPLTTAAILAKTYYNVNGHQPESVDWFNVLVAQTIAQLRNDAQQDNAILKSLTTALNSSRRPDFLDEIRVTEINLGEEFPIFSNCRVIPVESDNPDSARLQARMDVDLGDSITLGIETKLVLNYPKAFAAVLPVALAVSIVRFSGTLSISFIPSPAQTMTSPSSTPPASRKGSAIIDSADPTPPTTLTFSLLPDYRLELSTHSLLGSRSRLQDVPKIGQLVEARIHAWVDERCVEPRFQQVVLPSMWPRKKNTRGGEADGDDGEREFGSTPSKASPRNKRDSSGKPPPMSLNGELMQSTVGGQEAAKPRNPRTGFVSGREMEEQLRQPEQHPGLRDRATAFRMPGSMPT